MIQLGNRPDAIVRCTIRHVPDERMYRAIPHRRHPEIDAGYGQESYEWGIVEGYERQLLWHAYSKDMEQIVVPASATIIRGYDCGGLVFHQCRNHDRGIFEHFSFDIASRRTGPRQS